MRKLIFLYITILMTLFISSNKVDFLYASEKEEIRLYDATTILEEVMTMRDERIPRYLLKKCKGIALIPNVIKGGFIGGIKYGKGVVAIKKDGEWSPPSFISITGGSFGWQIGAQSVDVVLVIMNERGVRAFLKNKFTLGADASVAAGPVGRLGEISMDLLLQTPIYSYSKAKGIFAGATLTGALVITDDNANENFYGEKVSQNDILNKNVHVPPEVKIFVDTLKEYSK